MSKVASILILIMACCCVPSSQAALVTATYAANGTGTFNGTPIADNPFTLTFVGDTTNVVFGSSFVVTGTLLLDGFGTTTLIDPNPAFGQFLLSISSGSGIYVTSSNNSGFLGGFPPAGWNLAAPTPIPPGPFFIWISSPVVYHTTLGELSLDSISSSAENNLGVLTISPASIPEPSSLCLAAIALGLLVAKKRAALHI